MNSRLRKNGFTLVEILVAMTIITAILSMLYGSYFATARSAQRYKTRIALFQQGRKVLGQMARQIRCLYAGPAEKYTYPVKSISPQRKTIPENTTSYFYGNPEDPGGEILRLVTTNGISGGREPANGLFEVIYKFDKSSGTLSLSQERFIDKPKSAARKRNWRPITENIKSIELEFFDGRQWLNNWNFKDKRQLPYAIKIGISYEDENYQQYHYGTIAYVYCRKNQGKKTQSETLVAAGKQ